MNKFLTFALFFLGTSVLLAEPIREWDWHMPGNVYKELEFTDRAGVDRAVKIFQQAIDAERRGTKAPDLVPRYRAAAGEWRKVQVQAESADGNESVIAYAVFMQGYSRMQARDRNEAIKLFTEVLDLHAEEKFIAIPARYMLSRVKREMGDIKKADADLDEIIEDHGAEGHVIYYSVLRDRAWGYWGKDQYNDAIEMWSKIVYSKGKPDGNLWRDSRSALVTAIVVSGDFGELEKALFAGIAEDKKQDRMRAITDNVHWMFEADQYWWHGITQWLDRKYPREKGVDKRKKALDKLRRAYAGWLDSESGVFAGLDDGWALAFAKLKIHIGFDKPAAIASYIKTVSTLATGAKADQIEGRARALALFLAKCRHADQAREAANLVKNHPSKTYLLYEVENELQQWKAAIMYLEEYCALQPPPPPDVLRNKKYDLAWMYRHRVGEHEKAAKLYLEINDPPKSLWGYAEAMRACGKKVESYKALTEIVAMFPNDAAEGVLRTAEWREQDGEKEKAIALYRRLLKQPQWKTTRASSVAHQALERMGILTGGAMTNEVR